MSSAAMEEVTAGNPLPREIAAGLHWLGDCLKYNYDGTKLHAYNSVYLVSGDEASALVEGGHPADLPLIEQQVDSLLESGAPPLKYLFTTHYETPHCAGFGRLLERYPEAVCVGDVSDLHLTFPSYADRLRPAAVGERIDLGGAELVTVPAVIRDYAYTRWAFDTRSRTLFTGDGLAYTHYHEVGHCGSLAEEVPELDLPDMTALFAELAFYWTRFTDIEPYIEWLDRMVDELGVEMIAPTHGLPIGDLQATLPRVYDGLRRGSRARTIGSIE